MEMSSCYVDQQSVVIHYLPSHGVSKIILVNFLGQLSSLDTDICIAIFLIGEVEEIQWNTTREPKLILPNDYKWPLSLVEQKIREDNSADELAEQKGRYTVLICKYIGTDITNSDNLSPTVQGLIFLLSGNAGMSKTLTAEISM